MTTWATKELELSLHKGVALVHTSSLTVNNRLGVERAGGMECIYETDFFQKLS